METSMENQNGMAGAPSRVPRNFDRFDDRNTALKTWVRETQPEAYYQWVIDHWEEWEPARFEWDKFTQWLFGTRQNDFCICLIPVKDVIALIRAHYEKDEGRFRQLSEELAAELEKRGKTQLELYIKALLGETPTFVPM